MRDLEAKEADLHQIIVHIGVKRPFAYLRSAVIVTTSSCHAGVLTGACPSRVHMQLVYVISTFVCIRLTMQQAHGLHGCSVQPDRMMAPTSVA